MQNKDDYSEKIHLRNMQLIKQIKAGDNDKIVDLMRNNYGIIHMCLKAYLSPQTEYDDLMQEAYYATVRAVKAFDLDKGSRFSVILMIWLNHFMYRYANKANIRKAKMCVSLEGIAARYTVTSIEELIPELLTDDVADVYAMSSLEEQLWSEVRNILTEEDYRAVYDAFKNLKSYTDIGKSLGIGRSGARMRVIRALKKLRKSTKIKILAYDFFAINSFRWED